MQRDELVAYLNEYLRVREIDDASQNGLQVEGDPEVHRVAFAVDASREAFERAVTTRAQFLIVHHGLFWNQPVRLVGPFYQRVRTLILGGCSLYAAHLPLDAHPEVGNNAELARLLGLQDTRPFGKYHGVPIGVAGVLDPPLPLPNLIGRLIQALNVPPIRVLAHGAPNAHRVGIVSGDAVSLLEQAAEEGLDTFITGETRHSAFHTVAELEMNVFFAGHYATESVGLKALARHLEQKFGLETVFLDIPTGM
ncbi:MAG: Nif3-like dinuclear metal center hexameric protein [Anaerolineae bacterium]|nr:Nif3-like dinuclear metal center hexameric protein [Anaerolineae bacterium]MDW7992239.1 Nif3-like dinuclear metal center hexameric protein [Anaerolineae bacterium]